MEKKREGEEKKGNERTKIKVKEEKRQWKTGKKREGGRGKGSEGIKKKLGYNKKGGEKKRRTPALKTDKKRTKTRPIQRVYGFP